MIINRSATNTNAFICGCASSISPAVSFPPSGTSDACLATGPANPLSKRVLVFSTTIGSYQFTCNTDDNANPNQDCLNTMGRLCDPIYINGNADNQNNCKNSINGMVSGMSGYWQNFRRYCGEWKGTDGIIGSSKSDKCYQAVAELQKNGYYIAFDGSRIPITSSLTNSVVQGLLANPILRG